MTTVATAIPVALAVALAGPACYASYDPTPEPPERLDLLVMIDNSSGVYEETGEFVNRFRDLLSRLIDPPDSDGDTTPDSRPIEDIHLAVVSIDMGTMGFEIPTCSNSDGGDDGCFMHAPSIYVGPCAASYPTFLAPDSDLVAEQAAEQLSNDFACIASLGTNGCGIEQPLKSIAKALTDNARFGGCNEGFLRPDSVLAVLVLTDEDDCSVDPDHPEFFDLERADLGQMNTRSFLHSEMLVPVEEYAALIRSLRRDRPENLFFGVIAGVPPGPVCETRGDDLAACLALPEMQQGVNSSGNGLMPSCHPAWNMSYPPVRIVQFAMQLGRSAEVGSGCGASFAATMNRFAERIAERFPPPPTLPIP